MAKTSFLEKLDVLILQMIQISLQTEVKIYFKTYQQIKGTTAEYLTYQDIFFLIIEDKEDYRKTTNNNVFMLI